MCNRAHMRKMQEVPGVAHPCGTTYYGSYIIIRYSSELRGVRDKHGTRQDARCGSEDIAVDTRAYGIAAPRPRHLPIACCRAG